MLKKIFQVEDVGRFEKLGHDGDVTFRRLSVLFGENGGGKSTLSALLRAAAGRDTSAILERRRIGASGRPRVGITTATGTLRFDGEKWDGTPPPMAIYDRTFIEENVYVGREIGSDQRARLLALAIGDAEVVVAKKVDEIAATIGETSKEIRGLDQRLADEAKRYGLSAEAFVGLESVDDPAATRATLEASLASAKDSDRISKAALPEGVPEPPTFDPTAFATHLGSTSTAISEDAEIAVRRHLREHLGDGGEAWLREGCAFATGDACPFCGQSLDGVDLVRRFREFFDASYAQARTRSRGWVQDLSAAPGSWASRIAPVFTSNASRVEFWRDRAGAELAAPDWEELRARYAGAVDSLISLARAKDANVLDAIDPGQIVVHAAAEIAFVRQTVQAFNAALDVFNSAAVAHRESVRGLAEPEIRQKLTRLDAAAARHGEDNSRLVADRATAVYRKRELEDEKAKAREELEKLQASRMRTFRESVNRHLDRMAAGFTIESFTAAMPGGKPSAAMTLGLEHGGAVSVGGTGRGGGPAASIVLSEGDRSTLALAVFLASTESRPNLQDVVVVFDDPMSSLDRGRRSATRDAIWRLASAAAQIIVLSHDERFLFSVVDRAPVSAPVEIELDKPGRRLREWSAREACRADYFLRHERVRRLAEENDADPELPQLVLQDIRVVLEDYLRRRFPDAWGPRDWLGDFTNKLRAGQVPGKFAGEWLRELEELTRFSSTSHHAEGAHPTAPPSRDEIRSYAREALALIRG